MGKFLHEPGDFYSVRSSVVILNAPGLFPFLKFHIMLNMQVLPPSPSLISQEKIADALIWLTVIYLKCRSLANHRLRCMDVETSPTMISVSRML